MLEVQIETVHNMIIVLLSVTCIATAMVIYIRIRHAKGKTKKPQFKTSTPTEELGEVKLEVECNFVKSEDKKRDTLEEDNSPESLDNCQQQVLSGNEQYQAGEADQRDPTTEQTKESISVAPKDRGGAPRGQTHEDEQKSKRKSSSCTFKADIVCWKRERDPMEQIMGVASNLGLPISGDDDRAKTVGRLLQQDSRATQLRRRSQCRCSNRYRKRQN